MLWKAFPNTTMITAFRIMTHRNKHEKLCPGEGWSRGKTENTKPSWWNNGKEEILNIGQPKKEGDWFSGKLPGKLLWWNNGSESVMSNISITEHGWVLGRIKGKIFWNDGSLEIMSIECPGINFTKGKIKEKVFWTDGHKTVKRLECPGEGWTKGKHQSFNK